MLLYIFRLEPQRIRRRAAKDYETYHALMEDAELWLYADYAVTKTPSLSLHDQYALIGECIETPELLVFIRESDGCSSFPSAVCRRNGGKNCWNFCARPSSAAAG